MPIKSFNLDDETLEYIRLIKHYIGNDGIIKEKDLNDSFIVRIAIRHLYESKVKNNK